MFKKGDLVQLKSGGPVMTVTGTNNIDELITVEWFPHSMSGYAQRPECSAFAPEAIILVQPKVEHKGLGLGGSGGGGFFG